MFLNNVLAFLGKLLSPNKLNILIYHQVLSDRDPMRPSESTADEFSWQMALIKKYFVPLDLDEAIAHLKKGTLPSNAICVTFDDGYLNNLEVATPILKNFDIPATVFIATAFSQGSNMWNDRLLDLLGHETLREICLTAINKDPIKLGDHNHRRDCAHELIKEIKYLQVAERLAIINQLYVDNNIIEFPAKMMNLDQIKQLDSLGIKIGAHTVDHPILKVLDQEAQKEQIIESQRVLEKLLNKKITGFAYPNGKIMVDYDLTTKTIVEDLGFDYAVSTNWGITTKSSDKYQLNRFTPWDVTPLKFHLRLLLNSLKGLDSY